LIFSCLLQRNRRNRTCSASSLLNGRLPKVKKCASCGGATGVWVQADALLLVHKASLSLCLTQHHHQASFAAPQKSGRTQLFALHREPRRSNRSSFFVVECVVHTFSGSSSSRSLLLLGDQHTLVVCSIIFRGLPAVSGPSFPFLSLLSPSLVCLSRCGPRRTMPQ
jgi:hypothetical protein